MSETIYFGYMEKKGELKEKQKNFDIGQDLNVTLKGTSNVKKVKF